MTADHFREIREAVPFRPFKIILADGRSYPVTHRDFVWQSPAGRTIVVSRGGDSFSVLDLFLIAELEVDGNTTPDNGKLPGAAGGSGS